MARRYYNGTVREFNILAESFPSNLVAGAFRFVRGEFFEVATTSERQAPQVEVHP
jgi:LemA protein